MLLALQSMVCLISLLIAKNFRAISFRDFNTDEARKCIIHELNKYLRLTLLCRVSDILSSRINDLHVCEGSSIYFHPDIHNIQELDDHSYCVWRSALVRRFCHRTCVAVLWLDGFVVDCFCMGGYQRGNFRLRVRTSRGCNRACES